MPTSFAAARIPSPSLSRLANISLPRSSRGIRKYLPYRLACNTPVDGWAALVLYYMSTRIACVDSRVNMKSEKGNEMSKRTCHPGLDDRCRDLDGEIRQKRGDTLVGTLRKTYGPDFAPGVRSDTRLDTLRDRSGTSLSKILKGK